MIRILLADDHPVVRKGLRIALEEDAELQVVAEASDGGSALALTKQLLPDVAVLDIDMGEMDGFTVAREIQRQQLSTRIIFLTLHNNEELLRAALDLGTHGYILKDSAMLEIVAGVHAVAEGRPYLSSAMTARMLRAERALATAVEMPTSVLTTAEKKILNLIAEGLSSKEIGSKLSIHYRTVENHRTNMCQKLGISGANALLRFAMAQKH